jgi:hypothetical protein
MSNEVEVLKNKVASLATHAEKVHFSFDVVTSRWHTMLTDFQDKIKEEMEEEAAKQFVPMIEAITHNVAYAKAIGLYDLADHLKNSNGVLNSTPAALPEIVKAVTAEQVKVIDNAVVIEKKIEPEIESLVKSTKTE